MIAYCSCEQPVMNAEHDAGCRRCDLPVDFSPQLSADDLFDTQFEQACIVVTEPDADGDFTALDSDGALASYNVTMVVAVTGRLLTL